MNHGLGLEKVSKRDLSPFPSISGHLVAAERSLGVFAGSIDVDHAGLDPSGDLRSTVLAGRLHIGCEAIDRVVCDLDGILDVAIADHAKHRPKNLLARDRHVIVDIGENGRADVVSGLKPLRLSWAAGDKSRSLCDTLLDQRLDSI